MKVGTDGVLLGAWCGLGDRPAAALDIGTGTALLALMLAQRGESFGLRVDAVEIDEGSFGQACENVRESLWSGSVAVYHADIMDFARECHRKYDVIVCNPPYFVDSLLPPDASRTTARHTTQMTHDGLAQAVDSLLAQGGTFSVVLPYDGAARFGVLMARYGLGLSRRTDVYPTPTSSPKRSLMEFRRGCAAGCQADRLIIESGGRHRYSPEYVALTRDFYLKF